MQKAPLTFRLYQTIKCSRPVNRKTDDISAGWYTLKVKDTDESEKTITFDFEEFEGTIDKEDPTILHCIQKNPDYAGYEDLNLLNEHMLRNITGIKEWKIEAGYEDGAEELDVIDIQKAEFQIIPEDGDPIRIPVKAKIVNKKRKGTL